MQKSYQIRCPKCNNSSNFYHYGKDILGFQSITAVTASISSRTGRFIKRVGV